MTNEVKVYFALKGDDFDPDEFTRQSGLTPTAVFRKGEPGRYVDKYKFSNWEISTDWIANDVLLIDEIVDELIERIEDGAESIAKAVADFNVYAILEVVLRISMDENLSTPSLGFSSKAIAFLNRVGAEIDVDIYRNWG